MVPNNQRTHFAWLDSILDQIGRADFCSFYQRGEGPAEGITIREPVNDRILGRLTFRIPEPSTPHGCAVFSLNVGHSVREALFAGRTL
jgi:hypothetical protein